MKYSNNISEVNIMFQVDNKAIGDYISKLINSKFYSSRDFCRKWLALNNEEVNECAIRNKANKLSQIYKGSKGIQTYDLPVFSELLGVSFEQILSAGETETAERKGKVVLSACAVGVDGFLDDLARQGGVVVLLFSDHGSPSTFEISCFINM